MGRKRFLSLLATLSLLAGLVPAGTVLAATESTSRQITAAGTTRILGTSAPAVPGVSKPEIRNTGEAESAAGTHHVSDPSIFPHHPLPTPWVRSSSVAGSNPEVRFGFAGLNHFDQRFGANNGNQFSLEPPDQALCVGNGYTVESVNSVLRVYKSSNGTPLTGVQDLNTFFGYPSAIDRDNYPANGSIGPDVIDPVCHYDPDNHRFIVAITTLYVEDAKPFDYNGKNSIDIAVSNSGDPTGTWTIYHTPAQNDGTDGTPNHGCIIDNGPTPGPCFQDYPHIGGDANGVYITTNEYSTFGNSYNGAQIFAFSKAQLKNHPASITVTTVENLSVMGSPGFTVWPATSPAGQYSSKAHGTEFFLSTIAGDGSETGNPTGTANRIAVWALTNTSSLNTGSPSLKLSSDLIKSETYVYPPKADQKPGDVPMRDCLNDTTDLFGDPPPGDQGCWFIFLDPPTTWQPEVLSHLDSNDTRMQQTWYTNGLLWGSTGTAVKVNGETKTGIAWFAVDPEVSWNGKVSGNVERQGYLALANNNLTYSAIAMGTNGKGVLAFTVVGEDYFPSAGYATITSYGKVGPIHISGPGLGPDDGFTSYKAHVGDPPRTRWGDYGAAVTDGSNLWLASEYIGQTCDYDTWLFGDFTCGSTRTAYANWGTYLTKLHL